MASLVLGLAGAAVGSMFGMPGLGFSIGSAIGGQLFGSGGPDVEGARLSDLKVQVSTYGNMLPILYGTTRVTGNVIWSTDLIETKHSEEAGGKGGGGQTVNSYTYALNFAVALCEGQIDSVLRVWANGTLIFDKVAGTGSGIRFYNGDEEQLPDSLIEAYLGVGNVPAYRGTAYVVFENLQLEKYGNRIPNLSFEILAKASSLPSILPVDYSGYQIVHSFPSKNISLGVKITGGVGTIAYIDPMTGTVSNVVTMDTIPGVSLGMSTCYIENYFSEALLQNIFVNEVWVVGYDAPTYIYRYNASSGSFVDYARDENDTVIEVYGVSSLEYDKVSQSVIMQEWNSIVYPRRVYYIDPYRAFVSPVIDIFNQNSTSIAYRQVIRTYFDTDIAGENTNGQPSRLNFFDEFITCWSGVSYNNDKFLLNIYKITYNDLTYYQDIVSIDLVESVTDIKGLDQSQGVSCIDSKRRLAVCATRDVTQTKIIITTIHLDTFARVEHEILAPPTITLNQYMFYNVLSDVYTIVNATTTPMYSVDAETLEPILESLPADTQTIPANGPWWPRLVVKPIQLNNGYYVMPFHNEDSYLIPVFAQGGNTLAEIVSDISNRTGLLDEDINVTQLTDTVTGYAISQISSGRTSIETLQSAYYFDGVESENVIKFVKRGGASVATISQDDMAAHEYGQEVPDAISMSRAQEMELPREVNVTYLDQQFEYQQSTQKSQRMSGNGLSVVNIPLPIVMTINKAKEVADVNLFNVWSERTKFEITVSRKYSHLEPTDVIAFLYAGNIQYARILSKSEGTPGLIKLSLAYEDIAVYTQSGNAGSSNNYVPQTIQEILPVIGVYLDIPMLRDTDDNAGFYYIKYPLLPSELNAPSVLYKSIDGQSFTSLGFTQNIPTFGYVSSALGDFNGGNVFDEINTIEVFMRHGTLASVTELEVLNGANGALIGDEIIQFKTATLIATNTYRVSGLLRGRRGTDYAINEHSINEQFILLELSTISRIPMETSEIGLDRYYKTVPVGAYADSIGSSLFNNSAKSLECYSPVQIGGGKEGDSDVVINWNRRTRIGGEWRDLVDVTQPESTEEYEIDIMSQGLNAVKRTYTGITSNSKTYTYTDIVEDYASNPSWGSRLAVGVGNGLYSGVILGNYLYCGVFSSSSTTRVYRFDLTAQTWSLVGGNSVNSSWPDYAVLTTGVFCLVTDGTYIYAGTTGAAGDADVWRFDTGTVAWTKIGGDAVNSSWAATTFETVYSLEWYGSTLYAGLGSTAGDAEVWSWNGSAWTKIGGDGVNGSWATSYETVNSLESDGTYLYAGLGTGAGDAEVWRTPMSSISWVKIGGDSVNSSWASGSSVWKMLYFNSKLYVSVDAEVWSWNGSIWSNAAIPFTNASSIRCISTDGTYLYVGTFQASGGPVDGYIFRLDETTGDWTQIAGSELSSWGVNTNAIMDLVFNLGKMYAVIGSSVSAAVYVSNMSSMFSLPNPLVVDVYQKSAIVGRGFVGRGLVFNNSTPDYKEATKWRLFILDNNDGSNVVITEVEMFDIYFKEHDLCSGGTATASAGTASNAFDNSLTTTFSTSNTGSVWLQYEFTQKKMICQYSIVGSATVNQSPKSWKLQRYDGASWIDMHIVDNETAWTASEKRIYTL